MKRHHGGKTPPVIGGCAQGRPFVDRIAADLALVGADNKRSYKCQYCQLWHHKRVHAR